jgi:hypothetical protein
MGILGMSPSKQTLTSSNQPLSALGYVVLAILGLAVAIAATRYWSAHQGDWSGPQAQQVFYVVLVVLGLGVALLLFGVLRSSATLTGSHMGYKISLGGPAVATALVVGAGVWVGQPPPTYYLKITLTGPDVGEVPFAHNDSLSLRASQLVLAVLLTAQGDAFVNNLASSIRTISVTLNSQTFRIKTPQDPSKVLSSNELRIPVELVDPRTLARFQLADKFDQALEMIKSASDAKGRFVLPAIDAYLASPSKEKWAIVVADVDDSIKPRCRTRKIMTSNCHWKCDKPLMR